MTESNKSDFQIHEDDVRSVVDTVNHDSGEVRVEVLRALARLPLDNDGSRLVGRAVIQELDSVDALPADAIDGLLEAAAMLPIRQLRERLRAAARGQTLVPKPAAISALSRVLDPTVFPERIAVDGNDLEEWSRTVRAVTTEHRDLIMTAYFDSLQSEEPADFMRRFWLALALARLGELQPLADNLDVIENEPSTFTPFAADPGRLSACLRGLGPWPDPVDRDLHDRASRQGIDDGVAAIARALLEPAPAPLPPSRRSASEHSQDDAELAVDIERGLDEASDAMPLDITLGNELVEKALDRDLCLDPGETGVVRSYARAAARTDHFAEQTAWLVARGGVETFAPTLLKRIVDESSAKGRLAASRLLSAAALQRLRTEAPKFGGVPAGPEIPALSGDLIDDPTMDLSVDLSPPPADYEPVSSIAPPSDRPIDVVLGASAPAAVQPGSEFTARFVAYIESLREEAHQRLVSGSARAVAHNDLAHARWKPGTEIEVRVRGRHLEVDPPAQHFAWSGKIDDLTFDVEVAVDAPEGIVVLKYDVLVAGTRVAALRHDLVIQTGAEQKSIREISGRPIRSAFASYSSADRARVLDRVSALEIGAGISVFQDCLSLHPGEEWKPRLRQEILDNDLFLLFWSQHAAASDWVTWEWKTALDSKAEDALQLQPLDPLDQAPPPERLRHLHFDDYRMTIRDYTVRKQERE